MSNLRVFMRRSSLRAVPRRAGARCGRADFSRARHRPPGSICRSAAASDARCAGTCGRPAYIGSVSEWRRMNCFTMRSSSEWKLMTASRPCGAQAQERRVERGRELGELAVDVYSQRLKDARRGMLVALGAARAARAARNPLDQRGELQGALERARLPVGDDGARDARRQPLFAVIRGRCAMSSASDAPLTTSAALMPSPSLMRMSSGPSCMKLKPRPDRRAAARRRRGRTGCRRT